MNWDEEQAYKMNEQQMRNMAQQEGDSSLNRYANLLNLQEREKGMIKEQLDLDEELEKIEYLLRGYILKRENGEEKWVEPKDNQMIVLSEYGIHLVMNTISWYINKNTLLSNYDENTISVKMEDFATDLADTVFMEYEKVFQYPSFEDCEKILKDRLIYKTKMRQLSYSTLGITKKDEDVREEFVKEIEGRIEEEIEKIKQQIVKNKLKRFVLLIRVIQDTVHSTYQRAYRGEERRTLRQHISVTETKGGNEMPRQGGGGFFGWAKPR